MQDCESTTWVLFQPRVQLQDIVFEHDDGVPVCDQSVHRRGGHDLVALHHGGAWDWLGSGIVRPWVGKGKRKRRNGRQPQEVWTGPTEDRTDEEGRGRGKGGGDLKGTGRGPTSVLRVLLQTGRQEVSRKSPTGNGSRSQQGTGVSDIGSIKEASLLPPLPHPHNQPGHVMVPRPSWAGSIFLSVNRGWNESAVAKWANSSPLLAPSERGQSHGASWGDLGSWGDLAAALAHGACRSVDFIRATQERDEMDRRCPGPQDGRDGAGETAWVWWHGMAWWHCGTRKAPSQLLTRPRRRTPVSTPACTPNFHGSTPAETDRLSVSPQCGGDRRGTWDDTAACLD